MQAQQNGFLEDGPQADQQPGGDEGVGYADQGPAEAMQPHVESGQGSSILHRTAFTIHEEQKVSLASCSLITSISSSSSSSFGSFAIIVLGKV